MKAREISVGIQELGFDGERNVIIHFKMHGKPLEREQFPKGSGTRVKNSARTRKEKELRKIIEAVEFPEEG